jgi:hypothetical protein
MKMQMLVRTGVSALQRSGNGSPPSPLPSTTDVQIAQATCCNPAQNGSVAADLTRTPKSTTVQKTVSARQIKALYAKCVLRCQTLSSHYRIGNDPKKLQQLIRLYHELLSYKEMLHTPDIFNTLSRTNTVSLC